MKYEKYEKYEMKKVSLLLDELVKKKRWEKNFALEQLKLDWPKVVGKNIAGHTNPKFIKSKKLFIEVDSPIWSTQLNYMKDQVLETINSYYKKDMVNEVFFRIKE